MKKAGTVRWLAGVGLAVLAASMAPERTLAAAPRPSVQELLAGVRVNDVAAFGDGYVVATASGVARLDKRLVVRKRQPELGFVTALASDGRSLFAGSRCGLFKEEAGRWSRVKLLEEEPAGCDGTLSVAALCLRSERGAKGRQEARTLFVSLEDHATESAQPRGLYEYDVARRTSRVEEAMRPYGDVHITAMWCSGPTVYFGNDDDTEPGTSGQVFAVGPGSTVAVIVSQGMPRADEYDVSEITALQGKGKLLLVGRYAGYGSGQCILAARGLPWACLVRSEADVVEGISAIQPFHKGFLAGSGLMANVDSSRLYYVDEALQVWDTPTAGAAGQLTNVRAHAGRVFLCSTQGLTVLRDADVLAQRVRRP